MSTTLQRTRTTAGRIAGLAAGGVALVTLAAAPAGAHTGHPLDGMSDGLAHPLFGPDHLLAMVAVGVLAACATDRRVRWATPIAFVVGMVGGAALGFGGVEVPGVELLIAASVMVLGGLIAFGVGDKALLLPVVAAAMGAVHGHAHGAELPDAAVPLAYAAGFVIATAALHAAGAGVGTALRRSELGRQIAGAALAVGGAFFLLAG
ncbi:MAG: HupE/UreJ family protein [Acidimicrobiales bacterium]|nr:HupE/UreJ family protein [Acidimicrobiales bacterium]